MSDTKITPATLSTSYDELHNDSDTTLTTFPCIEKHQDGFKESLKSKLYTILIGAILIYLLISMIHL